MSKRLTSKYITSVDEDIICVSKQSELNLYLCCWIKDSFWSFHKAKTFFKYVIPYWLTLAIPAHLMDFLEKKKKTR